MHQKNFQLAEMLQTKRRYTAKNYKLAVFVEKFWEEEPIYQEPLYLQ